jgi:hypothetical protein
LTLYHSWAGSSSEEKPIEAGKREGADKADGVAFFEWNVHF